MWEENIKATHYFRESGFDGVMWVEATLKTELRMGGEAMGIVSINKVWL